MKTLWTVLALSSSLSLVALAARAQDSTPVPTQDSTGFDITVNSAADGAPIADEALTLREAIAIANGTLPVTALSELEQAQVTPAAQSSIAFDLPADDTTILLTDLLPPLVATGLTIDGTTQPGYGETLPYLPEIPRPVVSLTPAPGSEVFRGLTVAGDNITVRGLNLYGFWSAARATLTTPAADIFVANAPPPADSSPDAPPVETFVLDDSTQATQQAVIEKNWLGFRPDESIPDQRSAFGVVVFNGVDVRVADNFIQHHEGSGVLTGFRAAGLQLTGNAIIANGVAGMPDGVRLEGDLEGAAITNNLVCANDGSGIFLFKPEGSTVIEGNDVIFNGRRFERPALYVMGRGHQLLGNTIGYQPGAGVAVAAYPLSDRNLIRDNQFTQLDGLSIDLAARRDTVVNFQRADGPNPPRNSHHRRTDTANGAINAPEFTAYAFTNEGGSLTLTGSADPGSSVDLYRVKDHTGVYSPLSEPLMTTTADEEGNFAFPWEGATSDWVSAIASDPLYGTSEPSPVISVAGADGQKMARCPPHRQHPPPTTPPAFPQWPLSHHPLSHRLSRFGCGYRATCTSPSTSRTSAQPARRFSTKSRRR
ncbi:MAG: cell envelope biogenesis protein OmpA [Leptolyngbyaceae cyanobacterium]